MDMYFSNLSIEINKHEPLKMIISKGSIRFRFDRIRADEGIFGKKKKGRSRRRRGDLEFFPGLNHIKTSMHSPYD